MIALMYDGLELGKFYKDSNNILRLKLNNNISKTWLPYIFEIGLKEDMEIVIKAWLKERVFPKNRFGARKLLREIGLYKYDVEKIAETTRCSVITDPYWIVYEETDRYHINSIRGQMGETRYPYNSIGITNEEDYIWRK